MLATLKYMNMRVRKILRQSGVIGVSIFVIVSVFRLSRAGLLTPSSAPAGTFNAANEIFDALASAGFDSGSVTAVKHGNALQISRCIINRITGGTCP